MVTPIRLVGAGVEGAQSWRQKAKTCGVGRAGLHRDATQAGSGNIGALSLCRDDVASGRRDYHLRSTSGLAIAVIE